MVYDNRAYEDDEFVNGSNTRVNAKQTSNSTLEFTRNPRNKNEVSRYNFKLLTMITK